MIEADRLIVIKSELVRMVYLLIMLPDPVQDRRKGTAVHRTERICAALLAVS